MRPMDMRRVALLLVLPLTFGCTGHNGPPRAEARASDGSTAATPTRCSGAEPIVEGPTITLPMRRSGVAARPVKMGRGQNFQGVLPGKAGQVAVAVEQDAAAVRALPTSTVPNGDRLFPFHAADGGSVLIVATSNADPAVKYQVSVSIGC